MPGTVRSSRQSVLRWARSAAWPGTLSFAARAVVCAALFAACSPPDSSAPPLTVARVVDGDTVQLSDGRKVRYIGIDTPEPNDRRPDVRAMAKEATMANRRLVEGKPVRLEYDVSRTDRYGRTLGYVYVGEVFVNAELVRSGYASAYTFPPDVKHSRELAALEREAREARRGLWRMGDLDAATRADRRR